MKTAAMTGSSDKDDDNDRKRDDDDVDQIYLFFFFFFLGFRVVDSGGGDLVDWIWVLIESGLIGYGLGVMLDDLLNLGLIEYRLGPWGFDRIC
ncbi:hypothetical protein LWI29_021970 [Acer saccharum]|uniref:Uncharacterized protein n=1 Tax=Acer saccharum TaxID=4024 RepID=A0AA39TDE5_ACESA|nr:hypothetical protein LWI29_021970 [Acer saccharum]